jgi:hypothetical protein
VVLKHVKGFNERQRHMYFGTNLNSDDMPRVTHKESFLSNEA